MKVKDSNISLKSPSILFLSFFGSGFFPFAPGTFGSLATIPLIIGLHFTILNLDINKLALLIPLIILLTVVSSLVADKVQKTFKVQDPGWIVIDEVIGMLVTWAFISSNDLTPIIYCFIFFRFFDIIKIYPANYFDKKIKHGFGTIFDDVISGVYAGICSTLLELFLLK